MYGVVLKIIYVASQSYGPATRTDCSQINNYGADDAGDVQPERYDVDFISKDFVLVSTYASKLKK